MHIVQDILDNQFKDLENKDLQGLITIIHTHMALQNYWVIDNLCRDLSPDASKIVLVSVLRCSSSVKDSLPNWHILLKRVEKNLISKNIDPQKLLSGLIPRS